MSSIVGSSAILTRTSDTEAFALLLHVICLVGQRTVNESVSFDEKFGAGSMRRVALLVVGKHIEGEKRQCT